MTELLLSLLGPFAVFCIGVALMRIESRKPKTAPDYRAIASLEHDLGFAKPGDHGNDCARCSMHRSLARAEAPMRASLPKQMRAIHAYGQREPVRWIEMPDSPAEWENR